MTRQEFIERNSRQIYGGFASDDADISYNLINNWLNDAIGVAAKQNYKDAIQLDGVGYVNNSFYSTFSGTTIAIDNTDNFQYYITLPQIPLGIGTNEGIATLQFKDGTNVSRTAVPLSINQVGYISGLRQIPNKILYYPEGVFARIKTTLLLNVGYTWVVKMISGGDSTDLTSMLNVPADYFPIMVEYLKAQLAFERAQPKDISNDGQSN